MNMTTQSGDTAVGGNPVSHSYGWVFRNCREKDALTSENMKNVLRAVLEDAGFTVFGTAFKKFKGGGEGYTAVAIIGESSADIHTWPENGTAHIRLFYCDYTEDNARKRDRFLELMKDVFDPAEIVEVEKASYPV